MIDAPSLAALCSQRWQPARCDQAQRHENGRFLARVREQAWQSPVNPKCVCFGPLHVGFRTSYAHLVIVTDLWLPPEARGRGLASLVLSFLTGTADELGVHLRLRPCAFDRRANGLTQRELRAWYERYGFVVAKTWAHRNPQPPDAQQDAPHG
jgi:GNAT superfamily N-acetyltransferase